MQSIIRKYVIVTVAILSLTFLATGIISVNEETSYVISGEKEDVLYVQSTTSQRLLVKESNEQETEILSLDSDNVRSTFSTVVSFLPSPFSQILWGIFLK